MIDEQRSLVGATKALGFYQREIFAKYLTFGVSSTLLGTLAGLLIARFLVEPFILNGYQIYYRADITRPALTVWPTVIVFGAGLLLSVAARDAFEAAMVSEQDNSIPEDVLDDLANHPIEIPEWDEYEQSILRNAADTVKIAIRGGFVDMTVSKSFE